MTYELNATYENGVLKLDHPLPLQAQQRVKVVVQEPNNNSPAQEQDWWKVLQEIWAEQEQRGYVGSVTEIDHSDEDAYEARMREILKNTVHGRDDADIR